MFGICCCSSNLRRSLEVRTGVKTEEEALEVVGISKVFYIGT